MADAEAGNADGSIVQRASKGLLTSPSPFSVAGFTPRTLAVISEEPVEKFIVRGR